MRLRNDPKANDILLNNQEWFINDHISCNTKTIFLNNNNPIHLEIGSGKGEFIINKALTNNQINLIGIEKNKVICSKIIKKILKTNEQLTNLKIINTDAKELIEIFKDNKVDKIYLNFSDPWPKKRHTKNRLTNPRFLSLYEQILNQNGTIEFKTDNDGLFNYTIEVLKSNQDKYQIIYYTNDLYSELDHKYNKDNIATEYEKKFHGLNKNINKIIFKFKS